MAMIERCPAGVLTDAVAGETIAPDQWLGRAKTEGCLRTTSPESGWRRSQLDPRSVAADDVGDVFKTRLTQHTGTDR